MQRNVAFQVARIILTVRDKFLYVTCLSQLATQFCKNEAIRAGLLRLAGDFKMAAEGRVVDNECSFGEVLIKDKKLSDKKKN